MTVTWRNGKSKKKFRKGMQVTVCRRAYWKRTRRIQARLRVETKEPKVLLVAPSDTMVTVN